MERKSYTVNTKSGKKNTRNKYQQDNKNKNFNETNDLEDMIFWGRVFLHLLAAVVVVMVIVLGVNYLTN